MRRPPMRGPERDFPEQNLQGSKLLSKTLCATLCAREKWLPRHCPVSLSGGPYAATLCARSIILFKETGYVQDESSRQAMICQRSVMTNPTDGLKVKQPHRETLCATTLCAGRNNFQHRAKSYLFARFDCRMQHNMKINVKL